MKAGFETGESPGAGEPTRVANFTPPSIGEVAGLFPQLEVLELLGQGGMGAVYKARQPALDRLVALKILPPQLAAGPNFAERFTREARALARLNHPKIVAVHDFGQAGDFHYFVMEFVDGANLRQIERAGKLTPREALRIVPQICEALQFAHDEGVVHRDIKPENILVDKRGRVKIADFGIAKILGKGGDATLTGAKEVVGTPHYMAPEQVEKPLSVDHRADIYSLGVVFYEMLTGELPLGKFAPPSRKVQVDVRLDEIVLHTLEKEPERRYQHASEVKTDVETVAQNAANPPAPPEIAVRRPFPRPNALDVARLAIGLPIFLWLLATFWAAPRPYNYVLLGIGLSGFAICALTLVGWWPFHSLLVPDSGFSGRNLPGRKHAEFRRATGQQPAAPRASSSEDERIRRVVKGPAVGLLVTGILNWILIPLAAVVIWWIVPIEWKGPELHLSATAIYAGCAASLLLCSFIIFAALKMMRLEAHGAAVIACLAAILVTPGNVIGLPLGMWGLVTLLRPDVKSAFQKSGAGPWKLASWGALLILVALCVSAAQIGGKLLNRLPAKAAQPVARKFVRMVVSTTAMTFEGQPTTWKDIGALLVTMPDRGNTVLEFAVTSDQVTVAQQNEWFLKVASLAREHGFEYASFVGIHPLGSKGTSLQGSR